MLGVGKHFPKFKLTATVSNDINDAFKTITNETYSNKWLVIFFYPKDFTFICPTEIVGFGKLNKEFQKRNAQIMGGSIDSEFVHLAWRKSDESLSSIPFPLLSDIRRDLSQDLGILDPKEGVCQRATYIVDPEGVIRFVMITDLSVGRNADEVLRVLDALQTGELCPLNWKMGDKPLKVSA